MVLLRVIRSVSETCDLNLLALFLEKLNFHLVLLGPLLIRERERERERETEREREREREKERENDRQMNTEKNIENE